MNKKMSLIMTATTAAIITTSILAFSLPKQVFAQYTRNGLTSPSQDQDLTIVTHNNHGGPEITITATDTVHGGTGSPTHTNNIDILSPHIPHG